MDTVGSSVGPSGDGVGTKLTLQSEAASSPQIGVLVTVLQSSNMTLTYKKLIPGFELFYKPGIFRRCFLAFVQQSTW